MNICVHDVCILREKNSWEETENGTKIPHHKLDSNKEAAKSKWRFGHENNRMSNYKSSQTEFMFRAHIAGPSAPP